MGAPGGTALHTHPLTRRALLGAAAAGAVGLSLGRWATAAAAVIPVGPAETYVALRDAVVPLDAIEATAASARFEHWWAGQDKGMRNHVRRVFEALDQGAGGSFARAGRSERASLLDAWTHPSADPLADATARDRLGSGTAAISIAYAPDHAGDGRVPLI